MTEPVILICLKHDELIIFDIYGVGVINKYDLFHIGKSTKVVYNNVNTN